MQAVALLCNAKPWVIMLHGRSRDLWVRGHRYCHRSLEWRNVRELLPCMHMHVSVGAMRTKTTQLNSSINLERMEMNVLFYWGGSGFLLFVFLGLLLCCVSVYWFVNPLQQTEHFSTTSGFVPSIHLVISPQHSLAEGEAKRFLGEVPLN